MFLKNVKNVLIPTLLSVSFMFNASPVFATQTTTLDVSAEATVVDFTAPLNSAISINPNNPVETRFQYSALSITNNSTAPIAVYVDSFTDKNTTFEYNITPTGLPEGKTWENLTTTESAKYFALGLQNDATDTDWITKDIPTFKYVPEFLAQTKLGTLNPGTEGNITLDSKFGLAFKTAKTFNCEIVFSAQLAE